MAIIKSEKDLEVIRECGRRHGRVLRALGEAVRPGMTTKDLDDLAAKLITEMGDASSYLGYTPEGADRPFPASICVSVNEEIVHGIPNENIKTLNEGDIVSIDVGISHKGFFTDAAITVPVGKVDPDSLRLIEETRKALYAGIRAIKPGGHIGDIGYAISAHAKKAKLKLADGLSGHGVGRHVHEDPYVPNWGKRGDGEELVPGLVIAIEPMLNLGTANIVLMKDGYTYRTADKKRSAHFEHTVLITDRGYEILTEFSV
jgi:methionyl aminopeptidase